MVNLSAYFQSSRDSVAAEASNFGVPTIRTLIVCKRDAINPTTYLPITPSPHIEQINPKMVALYEKIPNLDVELTDLKVSGISKAYTPNQLTGIGTYYLIDAALVDGVPVGGIEADMVQGSFLEPNQLLHYSFLLRERHYGQGNL
jgi:hypothetical protein